jgi:hypothetical protein
VIGPALDAEIRYRRELLLVAATRSGRPARRRLSLVGWLRCGRLRAIGVPLVTPGLQLGKGER